MRPWVEFDDHPHATLNAAPDHVWAQHSEVRGRAMSELAGQVAIITGGTGGLGKAVTLALLEAGVQAVVTYTNAEERRQLEERAAAQAERLTFAEVNVTDAGAVAQLVERARDQYGRIDILAHLVGGYLGGKNVGETTIEEWHSQIDLNLTSAFVCMRAVLPAMQERDYGRIVAVSSRSGVRYSPGVAAYTASKAGLIALIGVVAEENHRAGITANCVLPSIIDTPANRSAMPGAKHDQWPKPEEIAEVVRFLAGPHSSLVSGAAIPVYGKA